MLCYKLFINRIVITNNVTELCFIDDNLTVLDDRKIHRYFGKERESLVHNVCNGNIKGNGNIPFMKNKRYQAPKCHLVIHFNPFLKLGPFHIEVKLYYPLRAMFHDFFVAHEMDWMKQKSKPSLSSTRSFLSTNQTSQIDEMLVKVVQTTKYNQTTKLHPSYPIVDLIYNESESYTLSSIGNGTRFYEASELKKPYEYKIFHTRMLIISKRIELATGLNVTSRHGSSDYYISNYGLAGSLLTHMDPLGYEQGEILTDEYKHLVRTGDYIATFMGWIEDTVAGGSTAFTTKNYEGILTPQKGSAGFWINLSSCHMKDLRAKHAGCPVLEGVKWIMNKWIYSFDQWKHWPCNLKKSVTFHPFNGMSL